MLINFFFNLIALMVKEISIICKMNTIFILMKIVELRAMVMLQN